MDYQNIDKENYRLVYFLPNSGIVNREEYVVILSPGEAIDDYLITGFTVQDFTINGDCSSLPCDRELMG